MEHRRQTTAGLHPTDLYDGPVPACHRHSRLSLLTFLLLCATALLGLSASAWVVVVDDASLAVPLMMIAFLAATVASIRGPGPAPVGRR